MLGFVMGLLWLADLRVWLVAHVALDSDALVVPDIWKSLSQGGRLGDWNMCPHPYLFPDVPVYALVARFSAGLIERQVDFGLVFGFCTWWTLARLMQRLMNLNASQARAYSAAGLLVLLPFLTSENGLGGAFFPGYHGGSLIGGLALSAWLLKTDRQPASRLAALWVGCLVGLLWASDGIALLWVLLSAWTLCLGLGGRARTRMALVTGTAWIVRGLTLWSWERQGMLVEHFRWIYFEQHAGALLASFAAKLPSALAGDAGAFLLASAGVATLIGLRRKVPLAGWLGAAALLAAWAGFGLAALQGTAPGRYFIGFVWFAAPWLPLACSRLMNGRPLPLAAAALWGMVGLSYFQTPASGPEGLLQARWLDAQMGARGLNQGLADYWHARPLRLLSDSGLVLRPVTTEGGALSPYAVSVDRRSFEGAGRVQFVVLNGLDPAALRLDLGPPREELDGQGLTVWIYARREVPERRPLAGLPCGLT